METWKMREIVSSIVTGAITREEVSTFLRLNKMFNNQTEAFSLEELEDHRFGGRRHTAIMPGDLVACRNLVAGGDVVGHLKEWVSGLWSGRGFFGVVDVLEPGPGWNIQRYYVPVCNIRPCAATIVDDPPAISMPVEVEVSFNGDPLGGIHIQSITYSDEGIDPAMPTVSACECGAHKTSGAPRGNPAHSSWCPWSQP